MKALSSVNEIDFPLNLKGFYSALELSNALDEKQDKYLIWVARSWGDLRHERKVKKLNREEIEKNLVELLKDGLQDGQFHSLEVELILKGKRLDEKYDHFVDFFYEMAVESPRQGRLYRVRTYAASRQKKEFIAKDILTFKERKKLQKKTPAPTSE